ncbi:PREDICTED: uncharacterized protein LOC104800215 [Tarenaya hassleriana]|uniref:uncharacterized protein LOC104800215 n=1 Tax=Tarenaya hassleriana TaxID=28532 RepID=UPI00053C378E|nr:PREDICTED: uncharacterized protein LOC104800215 [Tarenaya hassleriana]
MAFSDAASMERKVENLRALVVEVARSKRLFLPDPKLLQRKLLNLCSSGTPDHPPYGAMIHEAITELNEVGGSNEEAISQFIKSKYNNLPHAHTSFLSHHLAKLAEKEEILCDGNNCYTLPRDNDAAYVTEIEVDKNLVIEVMTDKKEEENVNILEYGEHKVENVGKLLKEQDLITGAATHAEGKASGEILRFEVLEAKNRDESLEEDRLTTAAQLLSEKDENIAVLQSEGLENQTLHNCELLVEEKGKEELGGGQYRENQMPVEGGRVNSEDKEIEGSFEVNNRVDESQQKQDQENEVDEVEDRCEQSDALMEDANDGTSITSKQGKTGLHTSVDTVKGAFRELERNEAEVGRDEYKRLCEKQTEACSDILALEKMLKQCMRSKEQNEDVSAQYSPFHAQHDVTRLGSLPLSKESCKQLWKFVHKIQGQLFEIIDSFDIAQVSNSESRGNGVESMGKGLFPEGPKKAKNPCKTGEIGSHTKPIVEETKVKRSPAMEAAELGESFHEQKQRKLCDGQAFHLLVPGGLTSDSSVSEEMETDNRSTETVAHISNKEELICVEKGLSEKKCQREKLDPPAEKQDPVGEMQIKPRKHDQVALQIERN